MNQMTSNDNTTTDKVSIQNLVEICYHKGLRQVIFSPGSRNAPLVIGFSEHKGFQCRTIADERVAAFFAMGQGIATGLPTIICCTSGTAALNYAPAIAEAYYQKRPLLIITADRPPEWIDMGIGQCMRQENVYANYIKESYNLKCDPIQKDEIWHNDRRINEAVDLTMDGAAGPVHINVPFKEPLYGRASKPDTKPYRTKKLYPKAQLSEADLKEINTQWAENKRKIVIVGMLDPNPKLEAILQSLLDNSQIILLLETTSNLNLRGAVNSIDRVLWMMDSAKEYKPDLLISIGGPIVSKKIHNYLNENKPLQHWSVNNTHAQDTYQALSLHIPVEPEYVLSALEQINSANDSDFQHEWATINQEARFRSDMYLDDIEYSDLLVFDYIMENLPRHTVLHLANSTPVRYSQLLPEKNDMTYHSNRGVSGIDGSTSTALGYASCSDRENILITGDISFFYDSNAFWINDIPTNLKVILINNGGGGIFRYIPGPDTTDHLATVFESEHNLNAKPICELYKLEYFVATSEEELQEVFPSFIASSKDTVQVMEIKTPRLQNAKILREYFKFIAGK